MNYPKGDMANETTRVAHLVGRLCKMAADSSDLTVRVVEVDVERRSATLVTVPDGTILNVDPSALLDCIPIEECSPPGE